MLLNPFHQNEELICSFGDCQFDYDEVIKQKEIYVGDTTVEVKKLYFAEQIHSDSVFQLTDDLIINVSNTSNIIPQVDALITHIKGIFLSVKYADCIPVLIYDVAKKVIAGIHSGRTGTEKNITGKTIRKLQEIYKSDPSDCIVALGPAICDSHYPVSKEIFEEFIEKTEVSQVYPFLDLKKVVYKQLSDSGISEDKIVDFPFCTFEDENYYSYRRDRTLKRQISFIGIKNG
ncbi:MAG: peptidoglycan editing factor PgeF [Candidatus Cloacimonetes bacterium]|nr:peptidoglycan editing factor PgeF [Candidatus Cloacimonadota bacterium]